MSAFDLIPAADYQDACDAIREKEQSTLPIRSGELGAKIRALSTVGVHVMAINAGKLSQVNGLLKKAEFPPEVDLTFTCEYTTSIYSLFEKASGLRKVTLTTKKASLAALALFWDCDVSEVDLSGTGCVFNSYTKLMFTGCRRIKKIIGELDFSACNDIENFNYCEALEEVRFKPASLFKNLNLRWSPLLSAVSVESVISGLADLSSSAAQTLVLHPAVKAKLTPEQVSAIAAKNWTVA